MAVSKAEKAVQLQELKEKFSSASSIIFTHYIGLKVSEVSDLRKKLREAGADMKVAKKTLMQIAAKEQGLPELEDKALPGPIACIFSFEDPAIGAQVAFKYGKDHPQVSLVGGIFEGKLLTQSDAKSFATIPSKQVLLAIFAGMLQSPLRSFMSMCNGPLTGFARATSELAKKKNV